MPPPPASGRYRGRFAPSPTGLLHLGHARTFWIAQERARAAGGTMVLRNDDLDRTRCRPRYVEAMIADMRWFGLSWREGPQIGGPFAPYSQSERLSLYGAVFEELKRTGAVYPCVCSRQDILRSLEAPHYGMEEPIYPGTCRPGGSTAPSANDPRLAAAAWRFRTSTSEEIGYLDGAQGHQSQIAGLGFGDFVVWRKDGLPAYQLACATDDYLMKITEVVRGEDLITSTFRQLLIFQKMGWTPPAFYHCPLVRDERGERLAKRSDTAALRTFREQGTTPEQIRQSVMFRGE